MNCSNPGAEDGISGLKPLGNVLWVGKSKPSLGKGVGSVPAGVAAACPIQTESDCACNWGPKMNQNFATHTFVVQQPIHLFHHSVSQSLDAAQRLSSNSNVIRASPDKLKDSSAMGHHIEFNF